MKVITGRSTIVVGASAGLLLLAVLYCVGQLWSLRQGYVEEIEAITPRTARLLGILESAPALGTAYTRADLILEDVAYPALRDAATTAAALQKDVRELITESGMSISGSQILPRQQEQGFDRLALDVTAEGNIDSLEQALIALESMRPLVFVKSLNVKPARVSRRRTRQPEPVALGDTRKVTARFQLISLRLKN